LVVDLYVSLGIVELEDEGNQLKKMLFAVKKLVKRHFLHRIPTPMPIGMRAFDEWAKDILSVNDVPLADDYIHALAAMVIQSPPQQYRRSKHSFVKAVRKAQANQVATEVMRELRQREKARLAAEEKEKQSNNQAIGLDSAAS
jgi:hypothetical protein